MLLKLMRFISIVMLIGFAIGVSSDYFTYISQASLLYYSLF
ncbi:hypothetical protein [Alkalihalobacillus sp. AL-G]|nr:hypothetical protein [Alkalihalobacillus sp. AL-G]